MNPARPRWRKGAFAGLAAAAAVLAVAAAALAPTPAAAADTSVTVDLNAQGAAPNHAGAGFLYGLSQDGSAPADSLLQPLAPTLFRGGGARIAGGGWLGDGYRAGSGYRVRIDSALSQARRVTAAPYRATYHLLVSDVWGADTTQPANTVYPCDNGDCSNWKSFVDQLVSDVRASGVSVTYDIWNEPDGTGFWQRGVNSEQYYQMWDTAVREIHRLDPSAKITGPSYSGYNHGWLDGFLGRTTTDGTLPDVLNWHFGTDPAADAADARALLSAHQIAQLPLTINEYLFSQQQNSAYTAWFLDRLSASGVSAAAHAIWSDCCGAGTLDSLLVGGQPTGQWYVYQAYAQLSGKLLGTGGNGATAVAAALDSGTRQVRALLGNNSGQGGTATVTFQNVTAASWLVNNGKVHVKVQRIPDANPLPGGPSTVLDSDVAVNGNSLVVPVSQASGSDAYTVTLTPGNGSTGPVDSTVIVDGTDTAVSDLDHFEYGANWGVTTGVPDMYQQTANWSYVGGATAVLRFTGTQVALHAVRDVDQGIMSLSVDGGTPVNVDDYAPSRNASGVVWTSPLLAAGSHTLTIVNTGARNGASSGNNIAVDRADISTS
ncbi:GH39 family glycosyl hydrolase [Actinacidiphila acididurans]|uniref:GH39 family glycosyl hydrolase n=1 Tax=Actinacidiphila acididurans TaxID=2784346 RepID=UPI001F422EA5|nr:beta-xylosidase [Actinacidiphila acididurans]